MDVTLHIGAHRCATTTFQNYMRLNGDRLASQGVGFWGPGRTRNGLFRGILPGPTVATGRDLRRRAIGRVQMHLARSDGLGLTSLVVSDENMMGTTRENLRVGSLYCGVGERMARYDEAFAGRISNVVVNIRSQDRYWASALGYSLTRGRGVPGRETLERLAFDARCWRDVIADVSCAVPNAQIWVMPFETYAGRPEAQLSTVTGIAAPKSHARNWLNATPHLPELRALVGGMASPPDLPDGDGRWQPFLPPQAAALRENYADDLMWLTGGAGGIARLMPDPDKKQGQDNLPDLNTTRGRTNGDEKRRMARTR
ncbi:MAG: hypothetical protein ACI8R4_001725 [Paracoccaceae bacterium]|jgi:hypothetical protein